MVTHHSRISTSENLSQKDPMRQQANTIPVIKVIAWKWIQELAGVKIFPKKMRRNGSLRDRRRASVHYAVRAPGHASPRQSVVQNSFQTESLGQKSLAEKNYFIFVFP